MPDHCSHECVCIEYARNLSITYDPCCVTCEHDTRKVPKGSVLTPDLLKTYGLEHAEYRGRQTDYTIEKFCEGPSVMGGDDFPDEKPYPYQTAICPKTIHYWFRVTELSWEHWVVK